MSTNLAINDVVASTIDAAEKQAVIQHEAAMERHVAAVERHESVSNELTIAEQEVEALERAFREDIAVEASDIDYATAAAKVKRLGITATATHARADQILREVGNVDKALAATFGNALARHLSHVPVYPTFLRPPVPIPVTDPTQAYVLVIQGSPTTYERSGNMQGEVVIHYRRARGLHADLSEQMIESIMQDNTIRGIVRRGTVTGDYQDFRVTIHGMAADIPVVPQVDSAGLNKIPLDLAGALMAELRDGSPSAQRLANDGRRGYQHERGATGAGEVIVIETDVDPATGLRTQIIEVQMYHQIYLPEKVAGGMDRCLDGLISSLPGRFFLGVGRIANAEIGECEVDAEGADKYLPIRDQIPARDMTFPRIGKATIRLRIVSAVHA